MVIGLVGAGNMARAMARGWSEPVLVSDSGSGRASALAAEVGGEAVPNTVLAERAGLVVLCHKPYQLDAVASEIAGSARAVASVLGGTPIAALQAAYPDRPVFRLLPNTPVEVNRGVIVYARADGVDADLEREVLALFGRLGRVVELEERLIGPATAVMGVGPAYLALIVEAWVDAAVRRGLKPPLASELAAETLAGTAELLSARGYDTLAVRREVTSPGGSTARGLAALERGGVPTAMHDALDAVLSWEPAQ